MSEKSGVVQLEYRTAQTGEFHDLRGLLIAMGMLLLAAATGVSGVAGLSVLSQLVQTGLPPLESQAIIASIVFAFGLGVLWLLTFGTLRLRRWVRPAMLLACVFGFCASLLPLVGAIAALPVAKSNMDVLGLLFVAVLFGPQMLVAAVIFALFNSKHVKKTLEHYDPATRWTDQYPLPVMGIALATTILALICACFWALPAVPFFGSIVGGRPQTLLLLILGTSFAISVHRQMSRRLSGLVIASALLLFIEVSIIYSACALPIDHIASAMGIREYELGLSRTSAISSPLFVILTTAAYTAFCLGYAYHNRHYFHRVPGEQQLIAA